MGTGIGGHFTENGPGRSPGPRAMVRSSENNLAPGRSAASRRQPRGRFVITEIFQSGHRHDVHFLFRLVQGLMSGASRLALSTGNCSACAQQVLVAHVRP